MNNPILSLLAQGGAGQNSPSQNNPLAMIMRLVQSGGNPIALLSQMGGPQAQEALSLISGKNAQQLRETAEKMAQQRGTTIGAIAQQLGLKLPE